MCVCVCVAQDEWNHIASQNHPKTSYGGHGGQTPSAGKKKWYRSILTSS